MNKKQFLKSLSKALRALRRDERQKSLSYYEELINDGIESGLTEEQAVADCGSIDAIASSILSDAEMSSSLKPKSKPINTALLIVGSPLWLALACAAFAVISALYISAWAIIAAMFAALISFFAGGLGGAAEFVLQLISGSPATAFMALGAGLICAGIGLFLFVPILKLAKCFAMWTAGICKKLFAKIRETGEQSV